MTLGAEGLHRPQPSSAGLPPFQAHSPPPGAQHGGLSLPYWLRRLQMQLHKAHWGEGFKSEFLSPPKPQGIGTSGLGPPALSGNWSLGQRPGECGSQGPGAAGGWADAQTWAPGSAALHRFSPQTWRSSQSGVQCRAQQFAEPSRTLCSSLPIAATWAHTEGPRRAGPGSVSTADFQLPRAAASADRPGLKQSGRACQSCGSCAK